MLQSALILIKPLQKGSSIITLPASSCITFMLKTIWHIRKTEKLLKMLLCSMGWDELAGVRIKAVLARNMWYKGEEWETQGALITKRAVTLDKPLILHLFCTGSRHLYYSIKRRDRSFPTIWVRTAINVGFWDSVFQLKYSSTGRQHTVNRIEFLLYLYTCFSTCSLLYLMTSATTHRYLH